MREIPTYDQMGHARVGGDMAATYKDAKDAAFGREVTIHETQRTERDPTSGKGIRVTRWRAVWSAGVGLPPHELELTAEQKAELVALGAPVRNAEADDLVPALGSDGTD